MKKTRAALLSALVAALAAAPAIGAERVVNIFNWSDYIDPGVLEDFTRETGVNVVYDTYDSNEMLESRLLAGATGYDIVVPSATFLERQIKAGVLQKIDRKRLSNAANIWSGSNLIYGPTFVMTGVLYLIICLPISLLARKLEKRSMSNG